jgi:alpha-D-ribose 1-methylphosphonate 5-triphosphate diphosphatase
VKTTVISNANIVTAHSIIVNGKIVIKDDLIDDLIVGEYKNSGNDIVEIDANGSYVIPGIIDIHTDAIDTEICPRGGADLPIDVAFYELEKRMCSSGITTVFHSMHLGYVVAEKMQRSKYSRSEIFQKVYELSKKSQLINHKIHLRYEITGVDDYQKCFDLINEGMIDLFSFMDHTPGQGQMSREFFMEYAMRKKGMSETEAGKEFDRLNKLERIEGERLEKLTEFLHENNIIIASHDDDHIDKVNYNNSLGIKICEFPINTETAKHATELNMWVVGGASNILRGGSTGNNLHVQKAIEQGIVNTLCSDYYPPSMLYSVFKLVNESNLGLSEAINLVTLNPAKAAGIDNYTGSIEVGKKADLLIVQLQNELPVIKNVITNGTVVSAYQLSKQNKPVLDNVYNN